MRGKRGFSSAYTEVNNCLDCTVSYWFVLNGVFTFTKTGNNSRMTLYFVPTGQIQVTHFVSENIIL